MRLFVLILILAVVALSGLNLFTYWALEDARNERDRLSETSQAAQAESARHKEAVHAEAKFGALLRAMQDARFAAQHGDWRLYEAVDSVEQVRPSRQEDSFVIHDVSLDQFADEARDYWRTYFELYNLKVRRAFIIEDDDDRDIHDAIQAARNRKEWKGGPVPDLNKNMWDLRQLHEDHLKANGILPDRP